MSNLKSLTFTSAPSRLPNNPKLIRRQRLIERLNEQLQLAQDPNFTPTRKCREVAADGSRNLVEYSRSIKPWWVADANGNLVLTVRYGLKTLEFEKGKAGIAVGAQERLVPILKTLIAATAAGELDGLLEPQKATKPSRTLTLNPKSAERASA
jgi:hypothetical protein